MTKRVFDLSLGILAFVIMFPLMVIIGVLILVLQGRPVLYKQVRPGLMGRPFTILKFRTMTDYCDKRGCILADSERLTSLGRVLRATSLDELPEIINVIKGEMSIVGPRPLLMSYLDRYTFEQMRRHEVKPGITGWAQINGRNAISWEEKFKLDVWYVDHQSFELDLKIIAMTLAKVLWREGINQPGHATMEEFNSRIS